MSLSKCLTDSIIARLPLPFLLLLVHFVDQSDATDHICRVNIVTTAIVDLLADVRMLDLCCVTGQFFNELERIDHLTERLCSFLSYRHQSNQARLQAILQHESSSLSSL